MSSRDTRGSRTSMNNFKQSPRSSHMHHQDERRMSDPFREQDHFNETRRPIRRKRGKRKTSHRSRERYSPNTSLRHRSHSREDYRDNYQMRNEGDYSRSVSPNYRRNEFNYEQQQRPPPLLDLEIVQPEMHGQKAIEYNDFNNMPSSSTSNNQVTTSGRIPEFNPDTNSMNVHEWLHMFSEMATNNHWSLDDKKFHFANKLAGSARRWFMNSKMMDEKWGVIKTAFKKAFPSEAYFYEKLTTMINRVKQDNETMNNYFYHKIALINECEFNGVKAVSCLIGGLNNSKLKSIALKQQFETPEDLYTFLCKTERDKQVQEPICTGCNSRNHTVNNCKEKFNASAGSNNNKKDRTILNVQGEMYNVILVNKYVVDVFINGIKTIGYVSLDCSFVTMREEDAWILKINYEPCSKLLRYFDKNMVKAIGVARIEICVDEARCDVDVYIVSNSNQVIPMVIGRSFMFNEAVKYINDDDGVRFLNVRSMIDKSNMPQHKNWLGYTPKNTSYHNPYD